MVLGGSASEKSAWTVLVLGGSASEKSAWTTLVLGGSASEKLAWTTLVLRGSASDNLHGQLGSSEVAPFCRRFWCTFREKVLEGVGMERDGEMYFQAVGGGRGGEGETVQ